MDPKSRPHSILITGASSGIGRALAEEYAARAALGVSDAQGIIHDSRAPLWKKPMSLLFPRDDIGKARAKRFDRAYMQLRSDGRYERMLAAGAEG